MAQEIAATIAGEGIVVQVNTEESGEVARRLGVRGIPAFFVLREGRVLGSLSGARTAGEMVSWFRNLTRGG